MHCSATYFLRCTCSDSELGDSFCLQENGGTLNVQNKLFGQNRLRVRLEYSSANFSLIILIRAEPYRSHPCFQADLFISMWKEGNAALNWQRTGSTGTGGSFSRRGGGKNLPFTTQIGSMDCSIMSLLLQRGGVAE